jgi:hypothetical protein
MLAVAQILTAPPMLVTSIAMTQFKKDNPILYVGD